MSPPRRGRDADPTPAEWLRDLGLALASAAVLLGLLLGLAFGAALAVRLALGSAV